MTHFLNLATIIIGRNEGERLVCCLEALSTQRSPIIYVDSGSTDGSVYRAQTYGAIVHELDMSRPFTAARARNAGVQLLDEMNWGGGFIQFVDGDCMVQPGWLCAGLEFLETHPMVAIVTGHIKERNPHVSVYNRLCDWEWKTPIGEVYSCGGNMMIRAAAFHSVSGFNPDLVAGEEPDLCARLRRNGLSIWKLDQDMVLHDAAMIRFSQWWKRRRRNGYFISEAIGLRGAEDGYDMHKSLFRILLWGMGVPIITLMGSYFYSSWFIVLMLSYPLQIVRFFRRCSGRRKNRLEISFFSLLGKFPEMLGVIEYYLRALVHKPARLFEYK